MDEKMFLESEFKKLREIIEKMTSKLKSERAKFSNTGDGTISGYLNHLKPFADCSIELGKKINEMYAQAQKKLMDEGIDKENYERIKKEIVDYATTLWNEFIRKNK